MRRLIPTAARLLATLVAVPACAVEPYHGYGGGHAYAPAWHHRPAPAPWGWQRPWRPAPAPAWHAWRDHRPQRDWRPRHDRAWGHDGGGRHAWGPRGDAGRHDRW